MKKTLAEWEEIKQETVASLADRLKPNISGLCPPVIIALDVLCIPQAGIAAVLKTKQPRISLFRQGKRQMNISEQERLCDLVDAMIEWAEQDNRSQLEAIQVQIDHAFILNNLQRAIIKKEKEGKHASIK